MEVFNGGNRAAACRARSRWTRIGLSELDRAAWGSAQFQPCSAPNALSTETNTALTPCHNTAGLVSGPELLAAIWPSEASRPSPRWLRKMHTIRKVPSVRIGRMVFFEVEKVRAALRKFEVAVR